MRGDRLPIVLVVTALAMVGLPALATAGPRVTRSSSSSGFEFGLIGGPHATGEGRAGLRQLVQDVAAAKVAFTVHHGGIGAGPAGCSDDQYLETRDLFDASAAPVIYTPSEDDWANCRSGGPDPGPSPWGSRSSSCTPTVTASASTNPWPTTVAGRWRTSPASKPRAPPTGSG